MLVPRLHCIIIFEVWVRPSVEQPLDLRQATVAPACRGQSLTGRDIIWMASRCTTTPRPTTMPLDNKLG